MASEPRHLGGQPTFFVEHGDAFAFLRGLEAESVDLVITDPPYASLERHRAIGTTTRLTSAWFPTIPNSALPELFQECARVLKPNTHMYLFCDAETAFVAKPMGEAAGLRFWKPLVWDKQRMGVGYHYRSRYEFILFFEKGKRRLHDLGVADVLRAPRIIGGYPTEKPVELAETLVTQSSEPGALVLDPFVGSGSVGVAAVRYDRHFLGCDVGVDAVSLTSARLHEAGGQLTRSVVPLRRQLNLLELAEAVASDLPRRWRSGQP